MSSGNHTIVACVLVVVSQKPGHFCKIIVYFISFVFCVSFAIRICVNSNVCYPIFYHGDYTIMVHVRRETGIHCLFYMTLVASKFYLVCRVWKNLKI